MVCCSILQALKRPGRLDREIYVGLPDDSARREIFQILFRKTPIADDVNIDQLVKCTQRYSGAEVRHLLSSVHYYQSFKLILVFTHGYLALMESCVPSSKVIRVSDE